MQSDQLDSGRDINVYGDIIQGSRIRWSYGYAFEQRCGADGAGFGERGIGGNIGGLHGHRGDIYYQPDCSGNGQLQRQFADGVDLADGANRGQPGVMLASHP